MPAAVVAFACACTCGLGDGVNEWMLEKTFQPPPSPPFTSADRNQRNAHQPLTMSALTNPFCEISCATPVATCAVRQGMNSVDGAYHLIFSIGRVVYNSAVLEAPNEAHVAATRPPQPNALNSPL